MGNRRSIGFRIINKIHHRYSSRMIRTSAALIPEIFGNAKNIFVYFDYEREFSGFETNISDEFVNELLSVLDSYKIKTTWFTVGEIFNAYPNTINSLIDRGHEIASHSYSHSIFQKMSKAEIKLDFDKFSSCSYGYPEAKGFHSPQGRWNPRMYRILSDAGYQYDLAMGNVSGMINPFFIKTKSGPVLRFNTLGDDWPLFVGNFSEKEINRYFINIFDKVKIGQILGIGLHPWILNSNNNIYKGFKNLLDHISMQDNVVVKRAIDYSQEVFKINE